MKLVEVVVLLGAQCISPVENTAAATEAAKVQCAVVVEKDTTAGTIRIMPAGASARPEVAAVVNRLGTVEEATIEPASAPPADSRPSAGAPTGPIVPPQQLVAAEPPAAPAPAPAPAKAPSVKEEAKVAAAEEPAPARAAPKKEAAPKAQASAKTANQCIGGAKPKWYKNADGRRKYRCVKEG